VTLYVAEQMTAALESEARDTARTLLVRFVSRGAPMFRSNGAIRVVLSHAILKTNFTRQRIGQHNKRIWAGPSKKGRIIVTVTVERTSSQGLRGRGLRAAGIFRPRLVSALGMMLSLGACAQSGPGPTAQSTQATSSSLSQFMKGLDVTAREPQTFGASGTVAPPGTSSTGRNPQAMIWDGDGVNHEVLAQAAVQGSIQPVNLNFEEVQPDRAHTVNVNFENADIKTVAHAILGDVLNVNYTIDPSVTGSISLSSRRPVPRAHLMVLLESALRAQGAVIIEQGGVYRIIPAKDATGVGQTNIGYGAGTPGYGISALPLDNISVESLIKILDGFGARPGSVRIDSGRNLLIVQGTTEERQALIDTALAFDVDWMRHQSVGMFPVQNAMPDVVIKELGKVVDPAVVRLQPVGQSAILAVSKSAKTIRAVSAWVSRLDRLDSNGENIHVYQLKNGDARKVASVLKSVFLGQSSSQDNASSPNEKDEVAPGGGTVTGTSAAHAMMTSSASPKLASATDPKGMNDADRPGQEDSGAREGVANGSKMRITADTNNNSVVVYANAQDYRPVERTLMVLDRPQLQVAIEATVAEVALNDALNYGVQAFLSSQGQGGTGSLINVTAPLPVAGKPGFNFLLGSAASLQVVLNALQTVTDVRVLSSPSLVVVDNQPAVLQVGDTVPVSTASATSVQTVGAPIVNQITYVDTGIILRVIPRVHSNATVTLDVEQVVSQVKGDVNAATLAPTISQRRVKSTVSVANGQTVVLAGLISEQRTNGGSGLPGIAGVPVIGGLLGNVAPSLQRTEIIVFIRPEIIRNSGDAQRVAEQLRGRMSGFYP
jgi:general secretion pathway protein D